jgi:hypothetical protein
VIWFRSPVPSPRVVVIMHTGVVPEALRPVVGA